MILLMISSYWISGRGHPPAVFVLWRCRSMTADFLSFHLFFTCPTLLPFPPMAFTESAICFHNISFLFSVTPFLKCDVNKSFSFSISSNKVIFFKSLHYFFTLFNEISPSPDIFLFLMKAVDNCPEGSVFVRSTIGRDCALRKKYWEIPL